MPTADKLPQHSGFYIPNAKDVTNPRMAEPDKVDFNTLAHPWWGVIEGCLVTATGLTVTAASGTLLVNGQLVSFTQDNRGLATGAQDRFDLVVVTSGGALDVVPGVESVDPVFPDPPREATVLAAVFCPATEHELVNNVIDKRKFVSKALLTKIAPTAALIRNANNSGNHFLLSGGGLAVWENDTWLERPTGVPETLSLHKNLMMEGTLTAGGNADIVGNVTAFGNVTGRNLVFGESYSYVGGPFEPAPPLLGSIWQDSGSGRISVWRNSKWNELATVESAIPPGTVITSLEIPEEMKKLGWIPLDGTEINEDQQPNLFKVKGLISRINSGTSPRTMFLPDARGMFFRPVHTAVPGTIIDKHSGNKVSLTLSNMPRHGHHPRSAPAGAANPGVTIGRAGTHRHNMPLSGAHAHDYIDPGHAHDGFDYAGLGGTAVIAMVWGGQHRIDGPFNDRNHPIAVEALKWTSPAKTGITIDGRNSGHIHGMDVEGEHTHTAWLSSGIEDHDHPITEEEVGSGTAFDITPDHMTVFAYIRT